MEVFNLQDTYLHVIVTQQVGMLTNADCTAIIVIFNCLMATGSSIVQAVRDTRL